jgi:hypothetical protein
MATVTPNFNWPVPTSTDLVKDGATAIEALGDSIDGSLVDLKGGTTGQVLSKTSGTDMDFTWVTTDDANAIQNSIVDAKGDLISATANDTPARLAVGANGETLVADSSTSTGLRYQAPVQQNPILNSAFQVWQRGTSSTDTNGDAKFIADRWQIFSGSTGRTFSRQTTSDTTNLPFIQYCMRVARNSGNTNLSGLYMGQNFESINSIPYAGRTVTMSFYARKGADFSAASSNLTVYLVTGTGTDQDAVYDGYTGSATPISSTATLTTTWQRFTYTGTIASSATEICPSFNYIPVGTAGAADYFEITGVQLEIGSVATPFKTYAATLQGELAACQRYYQKSYAQSVALATTTTNGCVSWVSQSATTSSNRTNVRFPVTMRTTSPTVTLYSTNTGATGKVYNEGAAADQTSLVQFQGDQSFHVYISAGTVSAGQIVNFQYTSDNEL